MIYFSDVYNFTKNRTISKNQYYLNVFIKRKFVLMITSDKYILKFSYENLCDNAKFVLSKALDSYISPKNMDKV